MIRGWRALLLGVAGCATLVLGGPSAEGFSWYQSGGYDVVWIPAQAERWMSPSTFPQGSDTDVLYRNALGLWMLVPSSDFTYLYGYYEPDVIDPYDGFSDTVAVPESQLDPGVLAVTYMVNNGAQWYDMDMLFSDTAAGLMWNFAANPTCEQIRDPLNHGISFLLVAVHELGHALGLGHDPQGTEPPGSTWFIGTMNPIYPDGGPVSDSAIVELHADDRNGMRFLYPHSGQSQTVVDLANAGYASGGTFIGKAEPATFTPTAVYPGEIVTMTSVIENFGNQNVFNVSQGFYLSKDPVVDTADMSLGDVRWDMAYGDGFEFTADANMPDDIEAGEYYLGSVLDNLDEVAEEYEDNNVHTYCDPLTVLQWAPVISILGQDIATCAGPYVGPKPSVTHPLNMGPLTWSIDNAPPGMTIDPATGVISWPQPIASPFLYTVIVRATNAAGSDTEMLYLGIDKGPPQIEPLGDQHAQAGVSFAGPTPQLTDPNCMGPVLNWSLDTAPAGMTIDHGTGVVSWLNPVVSATPHAVTIRATNSVGNGTTSFAVHVLRPGDMDCDGLVDFGDINPFVQALTDLSGYQAQYDCYLNGDINQDGAVDFGDINPFVVLLTR